MTNVLVVLRRLGGLAAVLVAGALLAGCVLTSATDLVTDAEATTPLPASFVLVGYNGNPTDGYSRSAEAPTPYTLEGVNYYSEDRSVSVRFLPLDDGTYMLAMKGAEPGGIYGIAETQGDVLVLRVVFGTGLEEAAAAAVAAAPAEIATDIVYDQGGIQVTRRDTLDYVVRLLAEGALPADRLVSVVAASADAPTPEKIVVEGGTYRAAD